MTSSEEGWWVILEGFQIQGWFNCVVANWTTSFGDQVAGFCCQLLISSTSTRPVYSWNKVCCLLPMQVLNFKSVYLDAPPMFHFSCSTSPTRGPRPKTPKKHLLTPKKPPHLIRRTGTSLEELNGLSCLFRHTCLVATGFLARKQWEGAALSKVILSSQLRSRNI